MDRKQVLKLSLIGVSGLSASWAMGCPPPIQVPYRGPVDGPVSEEAGFEYDLDTQVQGQDLDTQVQGQDVLTAIDIAHQLMGGELSESSIGHYPAALIKSEVLKAFETHFEDFPGDWYSRREYAIALIWDQQYERGAQVLLACYQADPTLVRIAFDEHLFGVGSSDLGVLSQNLVRFARRNDSAESWFAMSVILQGKGNYAHALSSLARAKELGFDKELVQSMETSLLASAPGTRG